jgi:hypothetical protein
LIGRDAGVCLEDETGGADTGDTVVIGVDRAVRDLLTLSVQVLSPRNADAGLKGGIVSLIFIAGGNEVGFDAGASVVSSIADQALACVSIVAFVGSASLADASHPVKALIAVALSIAEVTVKAAILIIAAFSVDH